MRNEILHKADQLGKDNVIQILAGASSLWIKLIILKTYSKHVAESIDSLGTYLLDVRSKTKYF